METKEDIIREVTRKLFRLLNKHTRLESLPVRLSDGTELTHRELHAIEAMGGCSPINVTDLGAHFGVTKSAASQMVTKLVAKGLVRKSYAEHSNKEYQLTLTKLGREAFQFHEHIHGEHLLDLITRLGAFSLSQVATISVMLEVMETVVDERIEHRMGKR